MITCRHATPPPPLPHTLRRHCHCRHAITPFAAAPDAIAIIDTLEIQTAPPLKAADAAPHTPLRRQ